MNGFAINASYSRAEVWAHYFALNPYPGGGNWTTGYVRVKDDLVIFANIGTPGRTGHDFPNEYDALENEMIWYGKPSAHSGQQTFRDLFRGVIAPQVFARWDSSNTKFLYLGTPHIRDYEDNFKVQEDVSTIRLTLSFTKSLDAFTDLGPEGVFTGGNVIGQEGKRVSVVVNRYERDPALRAACLRHHGANCGVCRFSFDKVYGELGKDFCHIHHITPLSESAGEHVVDPKTDMIPLCPNCHAMIHRQVPALTPQSLRAIMEQQKS